MNDPMKLAAMAVDHAQSAGAQEADARINRLRLENLSVKNGQLGIAEAPEEFGIGVRVFHKGCSGFAAAPLGLGDGESLAKELAKRALKNAEALSVACAEVRTLAPTASGEHDWQTPVELDAFAIPLADKLDLLNRWEASMKGASETVVRQSNYSARREEQWQATSAGARIHQVLARAGGNISTTAVAKGQTQRRSYPSSFGGQFKAGGFEHLLSMKCDEHGERMRDESVALCHADPCPGGERTLVIGGSQLMLQIHESVGHPNELDRVFGHEVDLAGSSFAKPEMLGGFQYGSEHVNLVADSTIPGGLDTRGFDDEGVASGRWPIVEKGVFQGFHTDRTWAGKVGEAQSRATCRSDGWYHPPIIRITNLSLMPGTWGFDELIADCEDGSIYMDTVKMWSIDQRRLNFQFTCEVAWEIQGGKLGRLLRNPTYQGTTPAFWNSCDAVCKEEHWELWGLTNCGKGNPMQVAEMSHGAAPARFRGVQLIPAE